MVKMKLIMQKVIISVFFGIVIGYTVGIGFFVESVLLCLLAGMVFCLPEPTENEGT